MVNKIIAPQTFEFVVRSFRVSAGFSGGESPDWQPSRWVIDLASEFSGPAAGKKNAIAFFYWPNKRLPDAATAPFGNDGANNWTTLFLHYPLSAFESILRLLEGPGTIRCFWDSAGPASGIEQVGFKVRQP